MMNTVTNTPALSSPASAQSHSYGLSIASLVTGILGIIATCPSSIVPCISIFSGLFSLAALITGMISVNEMNKSGGGSGSRGMNIAGIITGSIGLLGSCIIITLATLMLLSYLGLLGGTIISLPYLQYLLPLEY